MTVARMTFARTAAALVLCLALAACTSQDAMDGWASEPPCPEAVSERGAVRIARELAQSQAAQYGGVDIRAEWNDAVWSVLLTEIGGPYWLFVNVRADGRVIDCDVDVQCEPDPGIDVPACGVIAGEFIAKEEAATIARNYVAQHNLAPVPMRVGSASWFGAHWRVWMAHRGPAPVDSDFTVYVSPDGLQAERGGDMGIPSDTSFLFREPAPD